MCFAMSSNEVIAELGRWSSRQTFAKYMGKQVRLQGRLSAGNDPVIMGCGDQGLSGPCAPK